MYTLDDAIRTLQDGKPIIIIDDTDRENEGDLIYPAENIDAKAITFMLNHCSGIICLTLPPAHLEALELPLMVNSENNTSNLGTSFTVSIEASEGVSTGVSAADRATTIQKAIAPGAKPSDLARPGHVFPLRAHPEGILGRQGHTEASIAAATLAGFSPAAVLCELMNKDGTMARKDDIEAFASQHDLCVISTEMLYDHFKKNAS